jgi:hypothetical protein
MSRNPKPWPDLPSLFIKCRIDGDCLVWRGDTKTDKDGYPILYRGGRTVKMHRYVYSKINKQFDITNKHCLVRHLCNNPSCLRPEHLTCGSSVDNMKDRDLAGRTQQGERHVDSRLTEEQVIRIKNLLATTDLKRVELARVFKVNERTISQIATGKNWKHVTNGHNDQNKGENT